MKRKKLNKKGWCIKTLNSKPNTKKRKKPRRPIVAKRFITAFVIVTNLLLVGSMTFQDLAPIHPDLSYTEFLELAKAGQIQESELYSGSTKEFFKVKTLDGTTHRVPSPNNDTFKREVMTLTTVKLSKDTLFNVLVSALYKLLLLSIMTWMVYYFTKSMWGIGVGIIKPVAKRNKPTTTFADVAGLSEIIDELVLTVNMLVDYKIYEEQGVSVPKGILFYGEPGTGKTLIAKAIAGEANVPFFAVTGSDFSDMWVGQGAKRVKALCDIALDNAPCVIFIDELDSVGSKRRYNTDIAHDQSATLNMLLTRMDGLQSNSGILFIGATNRLNEIDPALLRAGRFDKHILVNAPTNQEDRDEIVKLHLQDKQLAPELTLDDISIYFKGLTGATIESCLNDAVIESIADKRNGIITIKDVDRAVTKRTQQGVIRPHKNPTLCNLVAIHEAGHALTASFLGYSVRKITTQGTGNAGGVTVIDNPKVDTPTTYNSNDLLDNVCIRYGGWVAETLLLGDSTVGCEHDLETATALLKTYVKKCGMGTSLVTIQDTDLDFDNYYLDELKTISEKCRGSVTKILSNYKEELLSLSTKLQQEETIYNYKLQLHPEDQLDQTVEKEDELI